MASQAWTGLCAIGTGAPFRDSKWVPDWTHPWIAKKQLFNSGFVKLMKRKMSFFRNLKWLIRNVLFINYWTLNVKNFYTSKYCIYILLAEYGMTETYFGRLSLRSMESNEQWTWPQGVIPPDPYGNVLSLYREGPGVPSCLKCKAPKWVPVQTCGQQLIKYIPSIQ